MRDLFGPCFDGESQPIEHEHDDEHEHESLTSESGFKQARPAATNAAMLEAVQGFRRLEAHKQLPTLRVAPLANEAKHALNSNLEQQAHRSVACLTSDACRAIFNRARDIPSG